MSHAVEGTVSAMIYWLSTGGVSALLLLSAATYVFHQPTIDGVRALGFPDFFRIELAVLKLMAAAVIILPMLPGPMKEWAYAGVALFILTAIVAHTAHGDPVALTLVNLAAAGLLATSYLTRPI